MGSVTSDKTVEINSSFTANSGSVLCFCASIAPTEAEGIAEARTQTPRTAPSKPRSVRIRYIPAGMRISLTREYTKQSFSKICFKSTSLKMLPITIMDIEVTQPPILFMVFIKNVGSWTPENI